MRNGSKALRLFSTLVVMVGLFAGVVLVRQVANFRGKAAGIPAKIVVDASGASFEPKNSWQFLAQGGEEQGRSLAPVIPQVKALRPRYIRIDHIYDFFHVLDTPGNPRWGELDAYLKDITDTGAVPFLSLSYTPKALGNNDIDMPDLNGWSTLVRQTIEHVSGRSGLGLQNVYYEVWNEPDLFGSFKMGGAKNYMDLYRASSNGAKAAQNVFPFKFGGPASTSLYKNWFDGLMKASVSEGVRFDFFSWHDYEDDINNFEDRVRNALTWEAASGEDIEIFVTEQGIDSANNPYYDSAMSAIHALASSVVAADKVDGMFHFEIKDGKGPEKFWGRWGLLTHEKWGVTPKPRYQALLFLNSMLAGKRVNVAGNGSWVKSFARGDENIIKLFVVNYDPAGTHTEAVPIRFTGVNASSIVLSRRDLSGTFTEIPVEVENREVQVVQFMRANTAAIFELKLAQ